MTSFALARFFKAALIDGCPGYSGPVGDFSAATATVKGRSNAATKMRSVFMGTVCYTRAKGKSTRPPSAASHPHHLHHHLSSSFPKLAKRFGNAAAAETLFPNALEREAAAVATPAIAMQSTQGNEVSATAAFPKRFADFGNERRGSLREKTRNRTVGSSSRATSSYSSNQS